MVHRASHSYRFQLGRFGAVILGTPYTFQNFGNDYSLWGGRTSRKILFGGLNLVQMAFLVFECTFDIPEWTKERIEMAQILLVHIFFQFCRSQLSNPKTELVFKKQFDLNKSNRYLVPVMLMTQNLWQNSDFGDILLVLEAYGKLKFMTVTKMAKTVTNILKLSRTGKPK